MSTAFVSRASREVSRLSVRIAGVRVGPDAVERLDQVPEAEVFDAGLPVAPAAPVAARTLQRERAAILDGAFARTPREFHPRAARVDGGRLVTGGGVVVAPDGRLVVETMLDDEHWRREFARPRRVRRARRISGERASLISLWSDNFHHWLVDCLPRFAVLQAVGLDHLPLIVPAKLSSFQSCSLRALGVALEQTTPLLDDDDQMLPDRLVWASPAAPVNFPSPFVVQWLRQTFGADRDRPAAGRSRRLLVSRTGVRRLINEEQLAGALEPLGFELLVPERLDLLEQVRTFSEAELIVGAHGAGLTNIAFAKPCGVLELFPPAHVAWHYYTLARAAGHDYWYLVGRETGADRRPRFRDFEVDVRLVVDTVEAMLAARQ
jgi:capsular polysaccharide biosynthesis protein